ncbi:UxaA family hydrolase [Seonamhaeicola marinus]|uniref:UxaA family hydrolase n=1 Tax=Seonamhaeicola marinus TaxID=1912246 RepID=A0A5D0IZY4_9FLAO|nr:UxaA family hydrolase [Seonamhaeicola marinus]TYA89244.1 UxaA family hydrolase [Seonamhaeicola marinus]
MSAKKVVVLHEEDNVGVAISNLQEGDTVYVKEMVIRLHSDIAFGHKIALKDLPSGEQVLKYGVPIGITTSEVKQGEHLHVHNMESLYMKQFTR